MCQHISTPENVISVLKKNRNDAVKRVAPCLLFPIIIKKNLRLPIKRILKIFKNQSLKSQHSGTSLNYSCNSKDLTGVGITSCLTARYGLANLPVLLSLVVLVFCHLPLWSTWILNILARSVECVSLSMCWSLELWFISVDSFAQSYKCCHRQVHIISCAVCCIYICFLLARRKPLQLSLLHDCWFARTR